jgi:hypothetical protein
MAGELRDLHFDELIEHTAAAVSATSCDDVDEATLVARLGRARDLQRRLDGLVARLSARADVLAEQGASAPGAEVLRGSGAVTARQARKEARRAGVATAFPALGRSLDEGRAAGPHLDAVADLTRDLTDDQRRLLDDAGLAADAARLPAETFRRRLRRSIDELTADDGLADTVAKQEQTSLRWWFDERTGMGHISGRFDPESYEKLTNAIDHHLTHLCSASDEPTTKDDHLAAHALIDLVAGGVVDARKRLPSVIVVVDGETIVNGPHPGSIRQTEAGHGVAAESISRLCCDATIQKVTLDDTGVPINVGHRYRTATDAQWAATKAIYSTCAWDGCDAPISWCQLHHILEWEHGGPTDFDNLVPLCSRHHHRVHEGQWSIKLLPDRTLEIFKPDGRHHATVPPPRRGDPPGSGQPDPPTDP